MTATHTVIAEKKLLRVSLTLTDTVKPTLALQKACKAQKYSLIVVSFACVVAI